MKQKRKSNLLLTIIIILILSGCSLTSGKYAISSKCETSVSQFYRFMGNEILDPKMKELVDGSTFIVFDKTPQNYLDTMKCIVLNESQDRESGTFFISFYLKERKALISIETNFDDNTFISTELYPSNEVEDSENLNLYYMRIVTYYPLDSMLRSFKTKKDVKIMVMDYNQGLIDSEFINVFMKALTNDQIFVSK